MLWFKDIPRNSWRDILKIEFSPHLHPAPSMLLHFGLRNVLVERHFPFAKFAKISRDIFYKLLKNVYIFDRN